MNVKKTFTIILLFLILFSATSAVFADDDRSYTIDNAYVDLTVEKNGLLHVDERYDYSFDGKFNGVYRDIPLKAGESIENVEVAVDGAYATYVESDDNGYKHVKIYLYADKAHTKGIRDCDVSVYISYDMKNVVTLFNDVGGLQYKLWGDEWDVGVGSVDVNVYLPGTKGNEYFLNPQEFNASSELNGDTITAKTTEIPKGDFYELLVLMPLSDFDDAKYAKHVDQNGRDMIMKNLEDSVNGRNFWNTTYLVMGLLSILSPIAAIFTYLRYGREPKVDYEGIYEREPPSDDPPEVVNALYAVGSIGTPNMDGFEAAILNLIDKKALSIETIADENTETNDLYINFNGNKGLKSNEKQVYNILHRFATDNRLNLSSLNSSLSSESDAKWFMEQYADWQESVKSSLEGRIEKEFHDTGTVIASMLSIGGIVVGIIIAALGFMTELKSGFYAIAGGVFLVAFSFLLMKFDDDKLGQWNPEGRVMYLKWKNFKEFLNDNSLINEHPPESIVIWRKYLIYGASLGVADEVYEAMKLQEQKFTEYDNDDIFLYHHYGGYYMMHNAFMTGESTVNSSSDSGGFGGVGGGSGGGGGGAF